MEIDFERRVSDGFGLTTAQIFYRRPDHLWLLQEYIWQDYDIFPEFPELRRFLDFWKNNLDGPLHSVMVSHSRMLTPTDIVTSYMMTFH